jgi:hypothetical protein
MPYLMAENCAYSGFTGISEYDTLITGSLVTASRADLSANAAHNLQLLRWQPFPANEHSF